MGAGNWPRILKLGHSVGPDFFIFDLFSCHVTLKLARSASVRCEESTVSPVRGWFIIIVICAHYPLIFIAVLLCLCHSSVLVKALCIRASSHTFRPFVRADLVTTICHDQLEQSRWNLQWIFTGPYGWIDKILEVKRQSHSRPSRWQRHIASTLGRRRPSSNFSAKL